MANVVINDNHLADLAKCIRAINGETTTYTIDELAPAILALPEPIIWTSWEEASWGDIYKVCKGMQSGALTKWPDDIYVGKTKTLYFTENLIKCRCGALENKCEVEIIGVDIDGPGVLTFSLKHSINGLQMFIGVDGYPYGSSSLTTTYSWLNDVVPADNYTNIARQQCENLYNTCEAKDYIKPLYKGTSRWTGSSKVEPEFRFETFWLPSEFELGLSSSSNSIGATLKESTEGVNVPYPAYTDSNSRKRIFFSTVSDCHKSSDYEAYYLRSSGISTNNARLYINAYGQVKGAKNAVDFYATFVPCFAIG